MAKNDYLAKQRAMKQAYLEAGVQTGRQQIIDCMVLALHDPQIMGKDTFGANRILNVVKGIGAYLDTYMEAFHATDESDYYQSKLDAALAEVLGDGMKDSFVDRYEYVKQMDYFTGKFKK